MDGLLLMQVLASLFHYYFLPYMLQVLVLVSSLFISYQTCLLFFFMHASFLTFFMHVLSFFFLYIGEQRNISSLSDLLCIFSFIYFIADIPSLFGPFISCHACPYLLGVCSKFIFNSMSNPDFAEMFIHNPDQYRYERKTDNAPLIKIAPRQYSY